MTKISAFSQAHRIFGTVDSLHLFFLQAWVPLSSLKHFTKYQRFFSCPEFLINWVAWSRTVYLVQLYQGNTHNYIYLIVTQLSQQSLTTFFICHKCLQPWLTPVGLGTKMSQQVEFRHRLGQRHLQRHLHRHRNHSHHRHHHCVLLTIIIIVNSPWSPVIKLS